MNANAGEAAALEAALALHRAGRLTPAIAAYRDVLSRDPDNADALNLLGSACRSVGWADEAIVLLSRAASRAPERADIRHNLGNARFATGDMEGAVAAFRDALAHDPRNGEAWANLGLALAQVEEWALACDAYVQAIVLDPSHRMARHNRANALVQLRRHAEAAEAFRALLATEADLAEAHYNLALLLLRRGDYSSGFAEYEWRWRTPEFPDKRRHGDIPDWRGEPLDGRSLLVWAEQGLGDIIQFARLLPLAASIGARVTFEVPPRLVALMQGLPGVDRVIAQDAPDRGRVDAAVPLMSLPHRLGLSLGSIPRRVPYLQAHPERVETWRAALEPEREPFVAVAWRGNPRSPADKGRSLPSPALLAPLADVEGMRLMCLHPLSESELRPLDRGRWRVKGVPFLLEHPGPGFDAGADAFLDAAAVMALAKAVVTTDTSIAHLAGAMARPTFAMLRRTPDWRWMDGREDSPWYPTLRLVRQRRLGDWEPVIRRVAESFEPSKSPELSLPACVA